MKRFLVLVLLCSLFAVAADAPKLSDAQNDKLMSAFKSAVMAQNEAQRLAAVYNSIAEQILAEGKFPKGTQLQPNIGTDKVVVVLPATEEKKK